MPLKKGVLRVLARFLILLTVSFGSHSLWAQVCNGAATGKMTMVSGEMSYCNGSSWKSTKGVQGAPCPLGDLGKMRYQSSKFEFCDGSFWFEMKSGSALSSCVGQAGKIRWNSNRKEFCDGTSWYDMTASCGDLTGLSNLILWLDASDPTTLTLSGSSVTQWMDKSVSGRAFAQATSVNQPSVDSSNSILPKTAINFAGASKWLSTGSPLSIPSAHSVFMVGHWVSSNSYSVLTLQNGIAANATSTATPALMIWSSPVDPGGGLQSVDNSTQFAYRRSILNSDGRFLASYLSTGNQPDYRLRLNRVEQTLTGTTGTTNAGITVTTLGSTDSLYLGNGTLGEVVVFGRALSVAEIDQVESYLRCKWEVP